MRLDGGHPALDLVNTVYGQVGGPRRGRRPRRRPEDLVTFARRVGLADPATPAGAAALRGRAALRGAVDALLRARLAGDAAAGRAARRRASRRPRARALGAAALAPTERRAGVDLAAGRRATRRCTGSRTPRSELLTDEAELARLHQCAGCCWLFLDHSRGAGRRWCSMADCGTEAKKRRYVQRRRERQQQRRAS